MSLIDLAMAALRPLSIPKYRLLSPLIPSSGTRRCKVFGATMDLDLADLIQRRIYIGCYEREETAVIRSRLKPGGVMLDVGANVGYFCALASARVGPTGRVFGIEPNPQVFAKLETMVRESRLTHCSVLQAGLSDHAGTLALYEPEERHHNLSSSMAPFQGGRRIDVAVRTLDDCLDEWNVDRVDLMKIDVEGHECRVFEGARKSLERRRIKSVVCEFNDYWLRQSGTSPIDLWKRLLDAGFRHSRGPSFTPTFAPNSVVTYHLGLAD